MSCKGCDLAVQPQPGSVGCGLPSHEEVLHLEVGDEVLEVVQLQQLGLTLRHDCQCRLQMPKSCSHSDTHYM